MQTIDIRISRARSALIMTHAFFGALAMKLIVVERNDIQTMATDGRFLFYCRKFLDTHSEVELIFTIAHEVLHCALSHMTRRGNRRWDLWQAATDYVINLMLNDAGFTVPEWVKYFDEKYRGLNVEQVYQLLEQEEQKQQQDQPQPQNGGDGYKDPNWEPDDETEETDDDFSDNQDGETGEGYAGNEGDSNDQASDANGNGDSSSNSDSRGKPSSKGTEPDPPLPNYAESHGDPGGCGEVLDAAPPHDQAALDSVSDEWKVYTRQAANIARRQGEGRLPGFIEEIVEVLNDPKTDWREVVRRFVDPQSSTKDFSWTKPNRRMMGLGFYVPGMISDGVNHIGFLIDTSGSIDLEWLKRSGCEVQAALDEGAIDKVTLVFADEKVHCTVEYVKGDIIDFTAQGRGGTRFSPAFDWINHNAPDVSAVIYLTDLECSDFGPEPSYPVLWAVYGTDPRMIKSYMERVPFGECLELRQ